LERAALDGDAQGKLLRDVIRSEHVAGTFAVSTCNRVEVYAEVDKFHAGVSAICEMLARHTGITLPGLTPHLYVHYEDRAVQHLLSMTCGLESMVVGESQILGQVRRALTVARKHQTLGRTLDGLGTLAGATAARLGAAGIVVASRTKDHAERLAVAGGRGRRGPPARLPRSRAAARRGRRRRPP